MSHKEPIKHVQLKIGEALLERIDKVVPQSTSRNEWMTDAVKELIEKEDPTQLPLTAEELISHKRNVMLRIDPYVLDVVDDLCEERKCKRTTWILDACITKLAST